MKRLKYLLLFFLAYLIFILSRTINLVNFPIFADEAIYIRWSQYILNDWTQKFISMADGKTPLHMWLMIPYIKLISDPLLAGRLFSVTCGLFSLMGIYYLTKTLFNEKAAKISLILYLFLPYSLMYDRLSLAEGPLLTLMIWFLYFLSKYIKTLNYRYAFLSGLFLGIGLLTKPNAFFFFPFIVFSLLLLNKKRFIFSDLIKTVFGLFIIVFIALLIFSPMKFTPYFRTIFNRSKDYSFTISEFLSAPIYTLNLTLGKIIPWTISYFTWPIIIIFIAGLAEGIIKKDKTILFLFLNSFFLFAVNAIFGRVIYPRYFLLFLPTIIPIVSISFIRYFRKLEVDLKAVILVCILIPSFYFDYFYIFKPLRTPFVEADMVQHLTDWSSGIGIREIVNYFKNKPNKSKIKVYSEGFFGTLPDGLAIFLNNYGISVEGVGVPVSGIPVKALDEVKQGYEVYLVANSTRVNFKDLRAEVIKEFPKPAKKNGIIEKLILYKINN